MKKVEMERLLMRQDQLKVIAERAEYLKAKYGEQGTTGGTEAAKVAVVRQLAHELPQTPEEIAANDHDVVARSELLPDLTQFIPDYREHDPHVLLRTLSKKFRTKPAPSELLLLENLINKITSTGQVDKSDEKLIEEAIQVLMYADEPNEKEQKLLKKRKGG